MALILFPKLALGLSGFETGVAVMPLVRGDAGETDAEIRADGFATPRSCSHGRADHERACSSAARRHRTLLIPPEAFQRGGPARRPRAGVSWRMS